MAYGSGADDGGMRETFQMRALRMAAAALGGEPRLRVYLDASSGYARLLLGRAVRDWTSGFKCFRRLALAPVIEGRAPANGYIFQVQGTYRVRRRGLRVVEVPIIFR